MTAKKLLLGAILSVAVLFTACSSDDIENTETTTSVTTAAVTTAPTETTTEETTTAYDTGNPEEGLVFFVQPIIEQYDEYDDWNLADWECRDTEVKHEYHYDNEWFYRKELIFVFSNYTDEPVTVDSIQIVCESTGEPVIFTSGFDSHNINFTVQPGHKTDYLLQSEDFDYSACESGIYNVFVNVGEEVSERGFLIDNSEVYTETFPILFMPDWVEDPDTWIGSTHIGAAPTFLTEEQQKVFAKAHARMSEFFWCDSYLPEDYAQSHTADDFIGLFKDVFTEEYAKRLAQGRYIDENGELRAADGGKGSNIFYCGHCFVPVSSDEYQVTFKAIVTFCHSDNPYDISFEERDFHMVNTENGWRVFQFDTWN